jgi:hypothetical protein
MGYLAADSDFGGFEHDNLDRSLAARYYATAYRALAGMTAADAGRVESDLRLALTAFQAQLSQRRAERAGRLDPRDRPRRAGGRRARGRAGGTGRSRAGSVSRRS